jgi:hypothetical protein
LLALTLPKEIIWPHESGESWFIDVFDWDSITVDGLVPTKISIALNLCSGIFPCSISIRGEQSSLFLQSELGFISCSSSAGCSGVYIYSINAVCKSDLKKNSIFKIQGSNIKIVNSHFSQCSFEQDGGIVQSSGNSSVMIESCTFHNISSLGFGGSVSAFGGSLTVIKSRFTNSFALKGGGAIWASAYQNCYGDTISLNTTIYIESSSFKGCSSGSAGGAILALGDTGSEYGFATLQIASSHFEMCQAESNGGAVSLSGSSVIANITSTLFHLCYGGSSGGAISASHSSTLALYVADFTNNTANGIGGGAVYLMNIQFLLCKSLFSCNNAPNGGGGAILWNSNVFPSTALGCPIGMYYLHVSCMVSVPSSDCLWATCAFCSVGKFKSNAGKSNCSVCAAGTYSRELGSIYCTSCPAGYYGTASGASSSEDCRPCSQGSFSASGASVCFWCPAGTYSNQTASAECLGCLPGKYLPTVGAGDILFCLECGHGQYAGDAATECSNCSIGTFADATGSTSCQSCRSGQYTSMRGATSSKACASCEAGQYLLPGNANCSECIAGVYADAEPLHQDLSSISSCAITALNGTIGRLVQGGKYSNNEKIYWLIKQSSMTYITLEFTVFEVEIDYDFISIYACFDETCSVDKHDFRYFSAYIPPEPQEFYAIAVLVIWTSDAAASLSGWKMKYRISNESLLVSRRSHPDILESHIRSINKKYAPSALISKPIPLTQHSSFPFSHVFSRTSTILGINEIFQPLIPVRVDTLNFENTRERQRIHDQSRVLVNSLEMTLRLRMNSNDAGNAICSDDSNSALYGQCLASDYKTLSLLYQSISQLSPFMFWPGLTFDLVALKLDAYNQIILSDSYSYVDLITSFGDLDILNPTFVLVGGTSVKLEKGQGRLSASIRPLFDKIDFLGNVCTLRSRPRLSVRGTDTDSQRVMQSEIMSMDIRNGSQVCPLGYILQAPAAGGGWATCSLCSAGTYSLNPLAPAPGSLAGISGCLNCPEGGNCDEGGAKVSFSVGKWEHQSGAYILKDCPSGFQLVNSTEGNSRGTFSHDRQRCKPCLAGQYIINSNIDECKNCPLGWLASCP